MTRKMIRVRTKKARKSSAPKRARTPKRRADVGEAAQIHQNIHPMESVVDLQPR